MVTLREESHSQRIVLQSPPLQFPWPRSTTDKTLVSMSSAVC